MAAKPKYMQLSEKYPNTIILQVRGTFYNAFSDSAKVLSAVFGYKLVENEKGTYKSGFPIDGSESKFEYLKSQNISFLAMNKDEIVEQYDASIENQYERWIRKVKVESEPAALAGVSLEESVGKTEETMKHQEFALLDSIRTRLEQFCSDRKDFSPETCFNLVIDEGLRKWGY